MRISQKMFDRRPKIILFGEVRSVSALPMRNTLLQFSKSSRDQRKSRKSKQMSSLDLNVAPEVERDEKERVSE